MTADPAGPLASSSSPPSPAPAASDTGDEALTVSHLDVAYRVRGRDRLALRDVSFSIGRGESYGLVGESGSGKSTAALALVRYLPGNGRVSAGTISINGHDPLSMGKAALRQFRAAIRRTRRRRRNRADDVLLEQDLLPLRHIRRRRVRRRPPLLGHTEITQDVYNVLGQKVCSATPADYAQDIHCPAPGGSRVASTTTWTYNTAGQVA